MRDRIELGDEVMIIFGDTAKLTGIVVNVPQQTGEHWIIKRTGSSDPTMNGDIIYVNPMSANLDTIIRM